MAQRQPDRREEVHEEVREEVKDLDPASLKGLAHPLRVRLLGALRTDGPATASGLARRFSETSGATSYHLRQLARHGFIEEDPERGTARERWWRSVHRSTRWQTSPFLDDPATAEAANFLYRSQFELETRSVRQWLQEQPSWPAEWLDAASASDWQLRLTADQLGRMSAEVTAVVERYRAEEDDPPGAERIAVFFRAFPQREVPL